MRPCLTLITGLCLAAGPAIAGEIDVPRLALLDTPKPAALTGDAASRREQVAKRAKAMEQLSPRDRMTALLIFLSSTSGGNPLGLFAK